MILHPLENSELYFIIDNEDFDFVSKHKWKLFDGYAVIAESNNEIARLHRLLLCSSDNEDLIVDHKNRKRLDNRRKNLRIATRSQNMCNRSKPKWSNATSNFKGVRYLSKNKYWQVRLQVDKKQLLVGHFTSEVASANMYNHYAKKLHGEFAVLNSVPFMSIEECERHKVIKRGRVNNGKRK